MKPGTVATYHATIRAFFSWVVLEREIDSSPMVRIPAPIDRPDQIQLFTMPELERLHAAAKKTELSKRNEALLLLLLDTGLRASEICALNIVNLDMSARRLSVEGKGGKTRPVLFSKPVAKAVWNYLREDERETTGPLFISERGMTAGEALTRSGLGQFVKKLGKASAVTATRCSPHTFRHTAAVMFLRAGGIQFALMTRGMIISMRNSKETAMPRGGAPSLRSPPRYCGRALESRSIFRWSWIRRPINPG